ncbi:MAG: alpha/beta hydrolase [Clostridia bacterium]|nr:alpha/beta hydrolase [Clostridia bacterium]
MANLRYPVLMVHGMGFRDRKHLCYWGRIPRALEELGCNIYFGNQDSNGSTEDNALFLSKRIEQIVKENNIDKFNVIAHSKGGLDMRYAISTLGMNKYVATLTTIDTPHNGSLTVDKLMRFPNFLIKIGCFFSDIWFRILGDKKPNTYKVISAFKTPVAEKFNRENPDDPNIYYQSFSFVCKKVTSDMFLWISNLIVRHVDGENDGLLTPRDVRWTNFRGIYRSVNNRGISHCDVVDMRRRPLSKKKGDGVSDIVDFYKDVVNELAEMGY